MKRFAPFLFAGICLSAVVMSCDEIIPSVPDDISGISLNSVDVLVEYTAAKVYGEIRISQNPERISEVRVQYGTSADNLSKSVRAAYDTENGFSADLTSLEDGVQFFYRVDIIVGKTPIEGTVKDFVTFPQGPIDLDLPSGKKWASHDLGATVPSEAGKYYAWGETEPKNRYEWSVYKFCKGEGYRDFTKYVTKPFYSSDSMDGQIDNQDELTQEDDVAHKELGGQYSIPTYGDWHELLEYCDISVTTINGTRGCKVSSKKDKNNNKKFIFLVGDTGYYSGTSIVSKNAYSYYWSSTLDTEINSLARNIEVNAIGLRETTGARYYGELIRPIYK